MGGGITLSGITASRSQAEVFGLLEWNWDWTTGSSTASLTAGRIHLQRLVCPRAAAISKIVVHIQTAGTVLTAGQNFVALFSQSGSTLTRVGKAAMESVWNGLGTKRATLDATYVAAPGEKLTVALLYNGGGTAVGTYRTPNVLNHLSDDAATQFRFAHSSSTSLTSIPSSIDLSSGYAFTGSTPFLVAVSE